MAVWNLGSDTEVSLLIKLNGETARSAAITCACMLEDRIEHRLAETLPNRDGATILLRKHGPMHQFSQKNDLAFALGIYQETMYREMESVLWIRNRFAHRLEVDSFDHHWIADRCSKLRIVENYVKKRSEMLGPEHVINAPDEAERDRRYAELDDSNLRTYRDDPEVVLRNMRERFITTCSIFMNFLAGSTPKVLGDGPSVRS